jgi:stage II sporulation protein D
VAATVSGVVAAEPARAAVPVLVVDGDGWGHGVGMAQDGAYAMAADGASAAAILGHFYGGTRIARATSIVRVVVLVDADRDTVVQLPSGGEVRSSREGPQAPGFPVRVAPGGSVRVRYDGRYRASVLGPTPSPAPAVRAGTQARPIQVTPPTVTSEPASSTSTTAPGSSTTTTTTTTTSPASPFPFPTTSSPTTAPPATPTPSTVAPATEASATGPLWVVPPADGTTAVPDRAARYRGVVQVADSQAGLRLVDEVDVEQYLRGMGEVPASWPRAALEAQAVASRTYAVRAMRASGELCDDQRCQVYLGQQAERPSSDAAVRATAGQVLTYGGALASTVFSANGGGWSATPLEGFGTPDDAHPYLRAQPYPTKTPDHWETRVALSDLAARLGYPGQLSSVTVAVSGPSGRPLTLALEGTAGLRAAPALTLSHSLGLRSTKWALRPDVSDAPPEPPPPAELVQALPDAAAQAAAAPAEGDAATATKQRAASAAPRPDEGGAGFAPIAIALAALALVGSAEGRRRHRSTRTEPDTTSHETG